MSSTVQKYCEYIYIFKLWTLLLPFVCNSHCASRFESPLICAQLDTRPYFQWPLMGGKNRSCQHGRHLDTYVVYYISVTTMAQLETYGRGLLSAALFLGKCGQSRQIVEPTAEQRALLSSLDTIFSLRSLLLGLFSLNFKWRPVSFCFSIEEQKNSQNVQTDAVLMDGSTPLAKCICLIQVRHSGWVVSRHTLFDKCIWEGDQNSLENRKHL